MKTMLYFRIMAIGLFIFLFAGNNLTAQTNWVKDERNPVFEGFLEPPGSIATPVVIYDDGIFKMWFYSTGGSTGLNQIYYSESTDGIEWTENEEPVIGAGENGAWDFEKMPGSVIRMGDTLKMWFSGTGDDWLYEISIGYAKRHIDDAEWDILSEPVLEKGEPTEWDEAAVFQPVVYHDGETYHMWYHGFEEGPWQTTPAMEGYATSLNGINWDKDVDNNPVITTGPDGSFYDMWVIGSCVLYLDGKYHMYFMGWDGEIPSHLPWRIGYATSTDGIEWNVENNDEPVVDVGEDGTWDDIVVGYCSVLFHENTFKMWYGGRGINTKIGYAEAEIDVGIFDLNSGLTNQIIVYPNPASNEIFISSNNEIIINEVNIYNQLGKNVLHQQKFNNAIDVSMLQPGIYILELSAEGEKQQFKLIKQ